MTTFVELRLNLATARADLRSARDAYEQIRAESEQQIIDRNGGNIGKNEAERARTLTRELSQDRVHNMALRDLRQAEANVDRLEALLEGARDARRNDEWAIRAQLAAALERAGIPTDSHDPAGDDAFDDVALYRIDTYAASGR